jgi:hypothetical protein
MENPCSGSLYRDVDAFAANAGDGLVINAVDAVVAPRNAAAAHDCWKTTRREVGRSQDGTGSGL